MGREALLADWLFAPIAFPELHETDRVNEYMEELRSKVLAYNFVEDDLLRTRLLAARQWADNFVETTIASILAQRPRVVGCSVFAYAIYSRIGFAAPVCARRRPMLSA